MKRKRMVTLLGSACLVLALAVIPMVAHAQPAPKMTLRFASSMPATGFGSVAFDVPFQKMITERTKGRITFETFWAGSLLKATEQLDAVGKGVLDLSQGVWIFTPSRLPLGCFEYNFLFNDPNPLNQVKIKREMYKRIPAFNQEMANNNLAPAIAFYTIASYDIVSRTPIRTFEDLKGKRIGHTPVEFVPALNVAGAVSVIAPAGEFYERLERGIIDAVLLDQTVSHAVKLQEVAKHYTIVGLVTPGIATVFINLDLWRRLTPGDQKLFMDIGKEVAESVFPSVLKEKVQTTKEAFVKAGVSYHTMSARDIKKWIDAMPDIPAEWARKMEAKGLPGWEVVDTYMKLSEEAGWKFPRRWGAR